MNVDGLNHCELAHRIVRETPCSYCGSKAGQRCIARRTRATPGGVAEALNRYDRLYDVRVLPPSASHRARIEAYWTTQPEMTTVAA